MRLENSWYNWHRILGGGGGGDDESLLEVDLRKILGGDEVKMVILEFCSNMNYVNV